ncbi:hypothetical protein CDAR_69251 [Caerostris darwini]|uniref:Maturase K n=1 Tax=Caerostris darwini TaxID=1538125 RepID=A0AAV4U0M0_9ARAC|nr:hypothetical protein CDAR_69251 [Caerostris darwini]
MHGTRSQRQRLWQWHGIKKTPLFGSRGYLFRIQTLKEFVLPVYLFHLSSRVAVELLFKKKKKGWLGGIIMDLVAISFEVSEFWREARLMGKNLFCPVVVLVEDV